ncbi:hypothetical protein BDW62DRAFT_220196 [Aspergillus aurantiobrunneus]
MVTEHVIDPEGEVTITLHNPNSRFAAWDASMPFVYGGPRERDPVNTPIDEVGDAVDRVAAEAELFQQLMPEAAEEVVRYRVSARHLVLGSPVFQRMLRSGWKEARELKERGTLEIDSYGFDSRAFLSFLRILHCRPQSLPRMKLEDVAKLGVVADYYECGDLVAYFANPVLDRLTIQPNSHFRTLLFRKSTQIAMMRSTRPISSLGLPIPGEIIAALNDGRNKGIDTILDSLHSAYSTLLSEPPHCTHECNALMLGSLMVQMHSHRLLSPRPRPPFYGMSHNDLKRTVYSFQCPPSPSLHHTIHYASDLLFSVFRPNDTHSMEITAPSFAEYYGMVVWDIPGLTLNSYVSDVK